MTIRGVNQQRNDPLRSGETWTFSHVNLLGQDKIYGGLDYDYINRLPDPGPYFDTSLRTWVVDHTPFLGKDKFYGPSGYGPDFDWPNPVQPYRIEQTWLWRQVDKIGKDKLPTRQYDFPNPQPVQWYQSWTQPGIQATAGSPFSQTNWPNPPTLSRIDQSWCEGFPTPGFLSAPFSQQDWPLSSQPYRLDQSWVESGNALGFIGSPFSQSDWPNPKPVNWYQDWNNALALNMPVFIPSVVTNWDVPTYINWYQDQRVDLLQTTLAIPPTKPFFQSDWANPAQPSRIEQTWAKTYNLYGQDSLPNRQQHWPTPYPVQWYQNYQVNLLQTTLFTTPANPPIRQYDWTVPYPPLAINPSWTYTSQFAVPAPIPPATIGGQYTEEDVDELTQAYARAMEFALKFRQGKPLSINEAAAALAKRGGEARAKSLSSSQRSSIAAHAASTRWKK
jgi:hypothetical protein